MGPRGGFVGPAQGPHDTQTNPTKAKSRFQLRKAGKVDGILAWCVLSV